MDLLIKRNIDHPLKGTGYRCVIPKEYKNVRVDFKVIVEGEELNVIFLKLTEKGATTVNIYLAEMDAVEVFQTQSAFVAPITITDVDMVVKYVTAHKGKPYSSVVGHILGAIFKEDWDKKEKDFDQSSSNNLCDHQRYVSFRHEKDSDEVSYIREMRSVGSKGQVVVISFKFSMVVPGWWMLKAKTDDEEYYVQSLYMSRLKDGQSAPFVLDIYHHDSGQYTVYVFTDLNRCNCKYTFSFDINKVISHRKVSILSRSDLL